MIRIAAYDSVPARTLQSLEVRMLHYYSHLPSQYREIAESNVPLYEKEELPFHLDLLDRMRAGNRVLEMGCGTGHFCAGVLQRGASYTGVDVSEDQIRANRSKFPAATFQTLSEAECLPRGVFDFGVSLYTLEHIVHPEAYLRLLLDFIRPGGSLAVICPEFVDGCGLSASVYFGRTARRFSQKLKSGSLIDAATHLYELFIRYPAARRHVASQGGDRFFLNLAPRCLVDSVYQVDCDAVCLVGERRLESWCAGRNLEIVARGKAMPGVAHHFKRDSAYVCAVRR